MFKKILGWLFGGFLKEKTVIIQVEKPTTSNPSTITNPWKIISFIESNDKDHILKIIYTNEIGFTSTNFCMALFETNTEYKLVAPWLGSGKILQKANITDLKSEIVSKNENSNNNP
jgi:hypothetical protein